MASREQLVRRVLDAGFELEHDPLSYVWLDEQVAALLEAVARRGEIENTLVVYCGDHNNEPGKGSCYEAGSRVPMIVAGPGVARGARSRALISNVDLLSTLLELCGLPPAPAPHDGQSFASLLSGRADAHRTAVYMENGFTRGIRTSRWKYIATHYPPRLVDALRRGDAEAAANHYGDWSFPNVFITLDNYPGYFEPEQLYDLDADPGEQHNLAGAPEQKSRIAEMRGLLQAELQRLSHPFPFAQTDWRGVPAVLDAIDRARRFGTARMPWWPSRKVRRLRVPTDPWSAA